MPLQLADTKPNPILLLLVGNAGAGKTTVATLFPSPYVIDLDHNLAGPKKVWNHVFNKPCPVSFDKVDTDEAGKPVPMAAQYDRFSKLFVAAANGDFCDTIVIDSTTVLNDVLQAYVISKSPTKTGKMEMASWGEYLYLWKMLLGKVRPGFEVYSD